MYGKAPRAIKIKQKRDEKLSIDINTYIEFIGYIGGRVHSGEKSCGV
jgi:hypothetical protein